MRRTALPLGIILSVLSLTGCGPAAPASTAPVASTKPATSQPPTTTSSIATPPPAAGGDFCAVTARQLDTARLWSDEKATPQQYIATMQASAQAAPAEVRDAVVFVTAETIRGVQELEGMPTTTAPSGTVDGPTMLGKIAQWKDWTKAHCSAEVYARWATTT